MGYRRNIYNKYMNFLTKKYWKHPKKKCKKAICKVFSERKEAGGIPEREKSYPPRELVCGFVRRYNALVMNGSHNSFHLC